MTSVSFYHLQRWPLERALPKLLAKTLEAGKLAVVVAGSAARLKALDDVLWSYDPASWLPHGVAMGDHDADQPVFLATDDVAPNGATFLFLTDGTQSDRLADFERCFDLFDGNDAAALQAARDRWKACKTAGHEVAYFQQTNAGGWERKA